LQTLEPDWPRAYLGQCGFLPRKHEATFPLSIASAGNHLLTLGTESSLSPSLFSPLFEISSFDDFVLQSVCLTVAKNTYLGKKKKKLA